MAKVSVDALAAAQSLPDENKRKEISGFVREFVQFNDAITSKEEELAVLKEAARKLSEEIIPGILLGCGIETIKLDNGMKVSVSKFYSAKIPDERKDEAFKFLEDSGNDSIIKSEVDMTFGKGEEERELEKKAVALLTESGIPFEQKRGIHPQTLKAFVKEQIESGVENFPMDLFGVYIGNKTKVKV